MTCGVWFRGGDRWEKKPMVEQRRAVRCKVGGGGGEWGDDEIEKTHVSEARKPLAMSQCSPEMGVLINLFLKK